MNLENAPLDEQVFVALQAYEELKRAALALKQQNDIHGGERNVRLSFTEIVHCVRQPYAQSSQKILKRVNQSLDARRKYRFALQQLSIMQSPQQRAASSIEQLLVRTNEDFTLTLSLQDDDYALIELSLSDSEIKSIAVPGYDSAAAISRAYLHCTANKKSGAEIDDLSIEVLGLERRKMSKSTESMTSESISFAAVIPQNSPQFMALSSVDSHIFVTL
ncbi:hypothetical protein ACFO4O_05590 [Glaciecola siphonariae]|uniref:Uncharacterized protein n=1 Tax=Glaciecola siphonariae TaxID=521012 RepID=A0ABV9LSZ2_9ALTE